MSIDNKELDEARELIKAIFDDGIATINDRDYKFATMTHRERKKIFAFYTLVGRDLANENFSFIDTPKFNEIEQIISDRVLFEGMQISKYKDHFDKYPEDYIQLISTSLAVMSYPFLKGNGGN